MKFTRILIASTALSLLPAFAIADSATTPVDANTLPSIATVPKAAIPGISPSDTTPVTKGELAEMVRQVLLNNPDILMQAAKKMHEQQDEEEAKQAHEGVIRHHDDLVNSSSPSVGDKNADVTIDEFFDYHCGYCRQLLPAVIKLTQEDKKVRVVFKEFPILAPDSVVASRAALAVNRIAKDKYFAFHQALMKQQGKYDESAVLDIAKNMGIDTVKLKTEMDKPEITAELDADRNLGQDIGVRGTPALVIGDQMYPGAVSYEELKKLVALSRVSDKANAPRG